MVMPTRKQIHPVLLHVLEQLGGRARPRDVVPEVTRAFPKLTEEDLKEGRASSPTLASGRTAFTGREWTLSNSV